MNFVLIRLFPYGTGWCSQVRLAGTGPVVFPVQERGPRRAEQPVGRLAHGVPGIAGVRAAGRREGAHHGPASPGAPVPRVLRLRAPAVRRAVHDQRQPARPAGSGRREHHGRGHAGHAAGRGRRQDHRHPFGHGPAHHRPRVRGEVRVLEQHPLTGHVRTSAASRR